MLRVADEVVGDGLWVLRADWRWLLRGGEHGMDVALSLRLMRMGIWVGDEMVGPGFVCLGRV